MPYFGFTYPLPSLPAYLFEADVVASIIPPQTFTTVPTIDGKTYAHWAKHINTSDVSSDLYAELYRSEDLETWVLLTTVQWAVGADYTDSAVLVGKTYYYKARFIRLDAITGAVTNTSDYTVTLAARVVSLLGFEPSDSYSNKFFQYLLDNLPGTLIYDRTPSATFSADTHDWQTTCKITDGFKLTVDGTTAHDEPADATALYAKRLVDFVAGHKHVTLRGQDTTTGAFGEAATVSSYLIHTFLMGYAIQFLKLYEQYLTIVSNKYVDFSQVYTKGFAPVVSTRIDPTLAELYLSFGKLLNLEPPKSGTTEQALVRYRSYLKSSFSNQDNTGKLKGITDAVENVLGVTTETILEYGKVHWFKTDRNLKLYVIPSGGETTRKFSTSLYGNSNLLFSQLDDRFTSYVQIQRTARPAAGPTEVMVVEGSSGETPHTYLFRAEISHGVTIGADVYNLFLNDPIANMIVDVDMSGFGTDPMIYDTLPSLLRWHSRYVGWENTNINMYGKKLALNDATDTYSGEDLCDTFSGMTSEYDPTRGLISGVAVDDNTPFLEKSQLPCLHGALAVARDDSEEGVGFNLGGVGLDYVLYGNKKMLFKISITTSGMQWLTKAYLKIFCNLLTADGYLRLYRVRKKYNTAINPNTEVNNTSSKVASTACWNYRDQLTLPSGSKYWDTTTGAYATATDSISYVSADWEIPGAGGESDAVLLKEFFVKKIDVDKPGWVTLDITDLMQQIYKYETSRLDMGGDPENILQDGFMLTAEGFPNKTIAIISGHSDAEHKPRISWERLNHGYLRCDPNSTTYFYVDGTERFGRLQVIQSDREPISYVKTVNELIRKDDIQYTDDFTVVVDTASPLLIAGAQICSRVGAAGTEPIIGIGTISSVVNNTLFIKMDIKYFSTGEYLYLMGSASYLAQIVSISYVGNKFVKLSRMPVENSILWVYHTGPASSSSSSSSSFSSSSSSSSSSFSSCSSSSESFLSYSSSSSSSSSFSSCSSSSCSNSSSSSSCSSSSSSSSFSSCSSSSESFLSYSSGSSSSSSFSSCSSSCSSSSFSSSSSSCSSYSLNTAVAYSSDYPDYSPWSESGPGITPVFVSSIYGTLNRFATQDTIDRSIILLNSTDSVLLIKDVIVTYQYLYDFYMLGRAVTDGDSVYRIEGSSRIGNGLFAQSEIDSVYKTEVMLPEPAEIPESDV